MKPTVRDHIQQLDVSRGGGIVSEKIRVDTIDNPMLVIGLGGTGIDALLRVKHQINRRFRLPEDPVSKKKKEKPDNIEFLAFETNEHDRNKKYNGIGLDPLTEFVLLSNAEVGSVLQNRSLLEPYIREWISPELTITDGINGASGIRQAGRLLLFTKVNQVVQTIERKINSLTVGSNKKLLVFLLTGLSGGTGSGCFLDIAYIVRGIMERSYGSAGVDRVNMLGYLFTPDVNLANKSLSEHTREYIRKNGYAALKELDYWMNADERGERFKQQYGNVLHVDSRMPPFNLAHLVSATNLDGKLLDNSYDYCMNVTAENISNFMASEDKQSGEEFAIHDYISNISTNIKQMPRQYAANYQYNILGASSAVIPVEEMTTYLAYKVFQRMDKMFESAPSKEDIEKLVYRLGFDPDSLHRDMNRRAPERPLEGYQHSERLSYNNVIKQQLVNMDTELEQTYLSRMREEYAKCRKQLPGEMRERFTEAMANMFTNPNQGPFYVSRMIVTDGGFSTLRLIQSYIESLKESVNRLPRDINAAKDNATVKFGEAAGAFIAKDRRKDAYIEAKIQEYLLRADEQRLHEMIELYEELYRQLSAQNSHIYEVFTELLSELNNIFRKNADILSLAQEDADQRGNRTYYWNVVGVPDVAKLIGKTLEERDAERLIREFTETLMEQSGRWVREGELDVVGSISEFLTARFGELITRSMEDYLQIKYGSEQSLDKLVEQNIAGKLHEQAKPVFHLSNSMGSYNFPSWGLISIPVHAPNIYKGIKSFQDQSIANSRFTIKESEVKNRIFWLNTQNGIPLFLYTPLKQYEESYERTILEQEGIGRHLVQNEKANWTYLPSPIPEKSWGDAYTNERIRKYNQEIRQLFADGLTQGCIRQKPADNGSISRYELVLTQPFDLGRKLADYQLQLQAEHPNLGEVKRCVTDLKRTMELGLPEAESRDIFGSVSEEWAQDNFIRSPDMIRTVREELAKYRELGGKIAELDKLLAGFADEEKQIQLFIEAMYTETVRRKGALYIYDHDEGEEPWESFVNVIQAGKFVEYEVFSKFRTLEPKKLAALQRKSSGRAGQLSSSDNLDPLLRSLRDMAAAYSEARSQLEYERVELANGEDMYRFYRTVVSKLNDILKNLA